MSNPFELGSALKFGLLFTVVLVASKAATKVWGAQGSYLASLLAGAADVDAVTISLSRMAPAELAVPMASLAIFIAAASNTLAKAGIAIVAGGWSYGWRVLVTFIGMIAAGIAAALASLDS